MVTIFSVKLVKTILFFLPLQFSNPVTYYSLLIMNVNFCFVSYNFALKFQLVVLWLNVVARKILWQPVLQPSVVVVYFASPTIKGFRSNIGY